MTTDVSAEDTHPIQGLMRTAMTAIEEMVDVNTVVGDAVETKDGTVIVPVSRVSAGFAAGGGEYGDSAVNRPGTEETGQSSPFGGGSGAGVSVQPVGFLVVGDGSIRFLTVDNRAMFDRLIDAAPEMIDGIGQLFDGKAKSKPWAGETPAGAGIQAARRRQDPEAPS